MKFLPKFILTIFTVIGPVFLQGCGVNRTVDFADPADNFSVRHKIGLYEDVYRLSLLPFQNSLDERDRQSIANFAVQYKNKGRGPMVLVYAQGQQTYNEDMLTKSINQALVGNGVNQFKLAHSDPSDSEAVSTVYLAFVGIKAKLAHRCGTWPEDLGPGSSVSHWENNSYYNFGCAYQNMIAVQVADPRDLVQPRAETSPDPNMRERGITQVRRGQDPGTAWKTTNSNIGSVGQ